MKKIKIALILILLINIFLRLPSLFDPVSYGDECIYLTLGQGFNQGLVFYRDIHDNKPPLLYLMAALADGRLLWLRLITIGWNTINVWLIYKLAKKILKKESAGLVASLLFAIFSFLPEGRIANGEIFMIMPATLGIWLALIAQEKKQNVFWFLSGLSFSAAFLFKVPVAFDFAGLLVAFFVFSQKKLKNIFLFLKNKKFYLTLIGFFLPILLTIVYYAQKGAFTPYVRSALLQNVGYLSSWGGTNWGLYLRAVILLIISGLIYRWRQQLGSSFVLLSLMTLFGLYGVFLSERPYPHYLMEIAPWAALLFTVLLFQKKTYQSIVSLLLIFLTLAGVIKYNFWWYPHLPYYQNFLKFNLGMINQEEYFKFFGEKTLNDYKVAHYLKKNTQEKERVFIWGDGVCIYSLARRLPPARYTVNYHIFDFNGFEETAAAIKEKQPNIIIKLLGEKRKFPQLEKILARYYIQTNTINEAEIYRRLF